MKRIDTFGGSQIEPVKVRDKETLRVANEVIVQLRPELARDRETHNFVLKMLPPESKLRRDFDVSGLGVVLLPSSANLDAVVKRLSKEYCVAYAEPHYVDQL